MNRLIPSILSLALSAAMHPALAADKAAASNEPQKPTYAAMVNGQPVLQVSIDYMLEARAKHGDFIDERLTQRVREELETQTLLAQELEKVGADKTPQIIAQLDLARLSILSRAYLDSYFKAHPVTEEELKTEYESKRAAGQIYEYHLRNILVKSQKEAQEISKQLNAGADFASLAKKKSLDPGANENGGEIGWVRPDIFIDLSFADAVRTLKKPGDFTHKPIPTRFGWNLLKLEESPRKVAKLPNYVDLPRDVTKVMRDIKMEHMLDELTSQLKSRANISG